MKRLKKPLPVDESGVGNNFPSMDRNDLRDYENSVARMWELDSTRIFNNGSSAHAGIIIESLLANAKDRVQILCHSLSEEVFDAPSLINKAKAALRRGILIEIIVQDKPNHQTEFMKFAEKVQDYNPISLNFCGPSDSITAGLRHNFAVADRKAYRLEPNRSQAHAIACVNDLNLSPRLSASFERFLKKLGSKK